MLLNSEIRGDDCALSRILGIEWTAGPIGCGSFSQKMNDEVTRANPGDAEVIRA
jgi:hypothetical protein